MTNTGTTIKNIYPYVRTLMVLLAALALATSLLVAPDARPAHAASSFFVNSTGDQEDTAPTDGICDVDLFTTGNQCTLRAALTESLFTSGVDNINFNIPGSGLKTMTPDNPLPVARNVFINGFTQSDAHANTLVRGNNALMRIQIDGSHLGLGHDGLVVPDISDGTVIRGLVISNFGDDGIEISGQNTRVEGNFIGTDATGTMAAPNTNQGVNIKNDPSNSRPATNNVIGGERPDQRNLISGNFGSGVQISSSDNKVLNNYIGTDKSGALRLGNGFDGVGIVGSATDNFVGNGDRASRNVIDFNQGPGVTVSGTGTGNRILSNSIFANLGRCIDLQRDGLTRNDFADGDVGPNNLQNFPRLSSATLVSGTTTVKGTLNSFPKRDFTVQFFASPRGDAGEGGKTLLGKKVVTTGARATVSFTFKTSRPKAGTVITATAMDIDGNTSEFSAPVKVAKG